MVLVVPSRMRLKPAPPTRGSLRVRLVVVAVSSQGVPRTADVWIKNGPVPPVQVKVRSLPARTAAATTPTVGGVGNWSGPAAKLAPCLTNPFTIRAAWLLAAQAQGRAGNPAAAAAAARQAARQPSGPGWPDPFLREIHELRVGRQNLADQVGQYLAQQRLSEAEVTERSTSP